MRARQCVLDIHIGKLVLDRLIAADQPTECIACERIILGHFQAAVGAAALLEGEQDRCAIENLLQNLDAFARSPQPARRGLPEHELSGITRWIERLEGLARDASGIEVDEKQARPAVLRCEHQTQCGDVAVGHRQFRPADPAITDRGLRHAVRHHPRSFRRRQTAD